VAETISTACTQSAQWLAQPELADAFTQRYRAWLLESRHNEWQGLDGFAHSVVTQGTTEVFDKFYMSNHSRRFRCFPGEYMYHQLSWRRHWPDQWCVIQDLDIEPNDAVVISLPFSDTGGRHPQHDDVLAICDSLGVPVLLDLAYFGICHGMRFDLDHACIQAVAVSLSKTFPVAHARIGMRLTRSDQDDPASAYHKNRYVNLISCGLGLTLMEHYGPDWIWDRYHARQIEFCRQLDVTPSNTVIFGVGDQRWQSLNRGGDTNRLCLNRWLPGDSLPFSA